MAGLIPFSYRNGHTFLHRFDVRCKMFSFIAVSLSCLRADIPGLLLITCLILTMLCIVHMRMVSFFYELRYFIFFLFFIFIVRAMTTPGEPVFENGWFPVTREGVYQGGIISWRMLSIVLVSLLFVMTTKTSESKEAIRRILKPIPFVPKERIATMITLMIRFIPLISEQIAEISEAQRARCVENRKNPVYRAKYLAIPLITGLFSSAQELAEAMESRCYSENRTPTTLIFKRIDWFCLVIILFGSILVVLL
ncbi:MAG: energy-coupling factor transporter transmembrane component T [Pseudomonadota bacterium]